MFQSQFIPLDALHIAATLFMTGLIWFVQIVHYPLLAAVPGDAFVAYEARHVRRTSWVVAPAMLAEALLAVATLLQSPAGAGRLALIAAMILLIVIWLSTALWQARDHQRLLAGRDARVLAHLARTNWLRTIAWSIRAALVVLAVGLTR